MKLLNVLPVSAKNLYTKEMDDYIRKYLSPDTVMDTVILEHGTLSIEGEYDECFNSAEVVKLCIQGEKDGYDAIFVNCYGDPGVRAARECVNIPVFGGFEPAIHTALGLADKTAIVSVLPNVLPMLEFHVRAAGLSSRIVSVRSCDIPVLDLSDHNKLCQALIRESIEAIRVNGAQAISLGCTAMVDVSEAVQQGLLEAGYDVPVIEASRAAVMMLEMYAKMGLRHSRRTYMTPTVK